MLPSLFFAYASHKMIQLMENYLKMVIKHTEALSYIKENSEMLEELEEGIIVVKGNKINFTNEIFKSIIQRQMSKIAKS